MAVADNYMYASKSQKKHSNGLEPFLINYCLHFVGHIQSICSDS